MAGSNPMLLRLFVAGRTPAGRRAVATLERIVADHPGGEEALRLEIIDILEEPERAEEERILATPTLIVTSTGPVRRLVGDLSDRQTVLDALAEAIPPGEETP